ncbi:hypothetical protein KSP40_PGU001002 [Platanthera guangdongensis]|uniref:Uncharacterized protein n=1 Tax=Platanthera guangdongensis TaxID=2320717 RepID=A0ABR2M354_9ASPA
MKFSLEHIEEIRDKVVIRQEEVKRRMARYFGKNVTIKHFQVGYLVLKKVDVAARAGSVGKLNLNWVGPFIVKEVLKMGFTACKHLKEKIYHTHGAGMI